MNFAQTYPVVGTEVRSTCAGLDDHVLILCAVYSLVFLVSLWSKHIIALFCTRTVGLLLTSDLRLSEEYTGLEDHVVVLCYVYSLGVSSHRIQGYHLYLKGQIAVGLWLFNWALYGISSNYPPMYFSGDS